LDLYLKSYSQSKFSQNLFLIKTEKEKRFGENAFSGRRRRTSGITPPLKPARAGSGSLTVGPLGPLVRFDQSPAPPSSSGRAEAGLRRSTPANGGSLRGSEGGDGSASPGRSSRWLLGPRGWRESPAASSAADGVSGGFGVSSYGGSWSRLRGWAAPQGRGEEDGGTGWAGEALLATHGIGSWRRPNWPEAGKTTLISRLLATGVLGRWPEFAWGSGRAR
jgi:hypothetical protein